MTEVHRTRLAWAQDIARAYRRELMKAAPDVCSRLDAQAIAVGQPWIAPRLIPLAAAEESVTAAMIPPRIAEMTGVPVGTIYSWISRGLLTPVDPEEHPARYMVRDVASIDARRKRASA
ncbi:hypothetical protein [Nocardia nova]|uniref:hypothetical protein n=1 Tax=Nocardia nova TaxID=37330 RepID=UPI00273A3DA5|nr:hypothetical protein [Nocardia nova]